MTTFNQILKQNKWNIFFNNKLYVSNVYALRKKEEPYSEQMLTRCSKPLPFHLRLLALSPLNTSIIKPHRQSNSQGSIVCFRSINHRPRRQYTAAGEAWICSWSHVKNYFSSVECVWAFLIWDLLIKDYFFPLSMLPQGWRILFL